MFPFRVSANEIYLFSFFISLSFIIIGTLGQNVKCCQTDTIQLKLCYVRRRGIYVRFGWCIHIHRHTEMILSHNRFKLERYWFILWTLELFHVLRSENTLRERTIVSIIPKNQKETQENLEKYLNNFLFLELERWWIVPITGILGTSKGTLQYFR